MARSKKIGGFTVEKNTNGKLYIHDSNGVTVGRLCQLSGEIFAPSYEANSFMAVGTVPSETFRQWRTRAYDAFAILIPDDFKPDWDKPKRRHDGNADQ